MKSSKKSKTPPGWIGGFPPANSPMRYPNPNLSSLPITGNLDNINLLQRQLGVKWPEFSWETRKGEADPMRCYQMFAPYISRIGYTDEGRSYSIICPQIGIWLFDEVCLNVEVTVTGQRGWVNENHTDPSKRQLAADIQVEPRVWFSPNEHQGSTLKKYWPLLEYGLPAFPLTKDKAIKINTFHSGSSTNPTITVRDGQTTNFPVPGFAKHEDRAYMVGHLEAEVGAFVKTGDDVVDKFNELVIDAFNIGSGNMLQQGNTLAWNVWFSSPELVNRCEWAHHAETWRKSIDTHHGSPTGPGGTPKYFNGSPFKPLENALEEALEKIWNYLDQLYVEGKF